MGVHIEPTHYKLIFEDPSLDGLEVVARELSIDELVQYTELLAATPNQRERVTKRAEFICERLVSWNLDDEDGNPLPITPQVLLSQPRRVNIELSAAWLREVVGFTAPPAPHSEPSDGGSLSSLPMETMSTGEPGEPE